MNRQEVFNKIYTHLLKQGRKSGVTDKCKYRKGELRCAIGCLITDSAYNKILEGRGVPCERVQTALRISGITLNPKTRQLLIECQSIHDTTHARTWKSQLQDLAKTFNLKVPA